MNVRELIEELQDFPKELDVWMEIGRNRPQMANAPVEGLTMDTSEFGTWVVLNDFPTEK